MAINTDSTFPALNTTEAEEIVTELGRALDSHAEWTEKFRTMLVCRSKPKPTDLRDDSHKRTVFGKWYIAQANPNIRDHPGFAAVGENSERMHTLARELAGCVRDGTDIKPTQYKAFVKSDEKFRKSLRKLLSEAWDFLRYTDPLTGVMTRTAMQKRLDEEQERVRRVAQLCCIGIMDLDHFKKVNDTYGHQAGDKVLETIASYVKQHLRRYDQVFRYGGEEFLILLPNTTTANAKRVLDRIRRNIKRQGIKVSKKKHLSKKKMEKVMRKLMFGTATHGVALAVGFALGVYFLPVLTAPESPDASVLEEMAAEAIFKGDLTRDLRGSDFLHWGEGTVSITQSQIIHEGRLAPGPDYKLYLVKEFVEHEDEFLPIKQVARVIGDVKTFDGFLIDVPADVDVAEYSTVLVWCEAFSEFITAVKYR